MRTPDDISIRKAVITDAPALREIYNHYVSSSTATFQTAPVDDEYFERNITKSEKLRPFLTAKFKGSIIGYCALVDWSSRGGYRNTAELSTYLLPEFVYKGIGTLLHQEIIAQAHKSDLRTILSFITEGNEGAVALKSKFGFKKIGVIPEIGLKFGRYLGLETWYLNLGEIDQ